MGKNDNKYNADNAAGVKVLLFSFLANWTAQISLSFKWHQKSPLLKSL